MERRGVPAAVVALERLAMTVGRAMARAHGVPDYPIAIITRDDSAQDSTLEGVTSDEQLEHMAEVTADQVKQILLTGSVAPAS